MPYKGFKSITVREEVYDKLWKIWEERKDKCVREGITSFSSFITNLLFEIAENYDAIEKVKKLERLLEDPIVYNAFIETLQHLKKARLSPRFEHFNCYEDHVTLWDRKLERLVNVYFNGKAPYVMCELCGRSDCEHVLFALSLPKVVETLRARGWRIEEGKIKYVPP